MFKYLFMLIAGAFILIFFVKFAMNYLGTAEQVEAYKLIRNFDNTLAIRSVSEKSFAPYELGLETILTFYEGEISSGKVSQDTNRIVYSPQTLKGDKIYIGTMEWLFPYKVDNFFYMTNDNFKYYFVYDNPLEDYVKNNLGRSIIVQNLGIDVITTNDLKADISTIERSTVAYEKVRFVYFTQSGNSRPIEGKINSLTNAEFIIIIPETTEENEQGKVNFGTEEIPYLGRAMLFGAVFAEDSDSYVYNFDRANKRFVQVADVYINKARYIQGIKKCSSAGIVAAQLDALKTGFVENKINEIDINHLMQRVDAVKKVNKDPGVGCPDVF